MSPSQYFTEEFLHLSDTLPCTKPPLPCNLSNASHDHLSLETHRNAEQAHQGTQPYRNHTAASKRHALKTTYSSGLYATPPESQLLPQTKIQIYERARTHVLMTDSATSLPHSLICHPEIHRSSAPTLHIQMLAHPFTIIIQH
jgi:hypothetical protein